jgi:catechol 2,3-dioxygenase-like lactoylglutathione lyase family enzyme
MKNIFRHAATAGILCLGFYALEGRPATTLVNVSEPPAIHRMDHVGINVTDLQRSADWYQKALGFTIFHKWKTTWMVSRGDMHLGLFLRPNAKKIDDLDNTLAITHFAYATDDEGFQKAQDRLTKLGIKFDPPEDTGVAHSIFIYDPDGYQVEITSYYK